MACLWNGKKAEESEDKREDFFLNLGFSQSEAF